MSAKSRYLDARPFVAADGAEIAFPGHRPREIGGAAGVIQHTVKRGERLDALARHYYNDDRLWWRIVDANPESLCGTDLVLDRDLKDENGLVARPSMVGKVIRIPRARE